MCVDFLYVSFVCVDPLYVQIFARHVLFSPDHAAKETYMDEDVAMNSQSAVSQNDSSLADVMRQNHHEHHHLHHHWHISHSDGVGCSNGNKFFWPCLKPICISHRLTDTYRISPTDE